MSHRALVELQSRSVLPYSDGLHIDGRHSLSSDSHEELPSHIKYGGRGIPGRHRATSGDKSHMEWCRIQSREYLHSCDEGPSCELDSPNGALSGELRDGHLCRSAGNRLAHGHGTHR